MNQSARKSLDRILDRMARKTSRPRRRISTAPLVLGLGLILADVFLAGLVPRIWESLLPNGLEQARTFRGWPGLIWSSVLYCRAYQNAVRIGIVAAVVLSVALSVVFRPFRYLVWLSAFGMILLNAGILTVTILASLSANAEVAGF